MTFQNKPLADLRIASFLPAATEMVYALGLENHLLGVTHECDTPRQARSKPIVVRPAIDFASLDISQIDKTVSQRAGSGQSLYTLDESLLRSLAPNLILTQDLCQVCAPSGHEATQLLGSLSPRPEVFYLTPHSFEEVLRDMLALGERTGTLVRAQELVQQARAKVEKIAEGTVKLDPLRVFFMEWVDPVYCGGHWIPQMLRWAGGKDPLAKSGSDSIRVAWKAVLQADPEVLIVSPCGFGAAEAAEQAKALASRPGWEKLAAVRKGQVFAVDGNAYFARPSLRLAQGVELLAHLFHPEAFPWTGPPDAFKKLTAAS